MIVASCLCLTEAANIFTIQCENRYYMYCEVKLLSRVRPFATPWTVAYQAPPSMGFSRQEYWSGVPLPSNHCKSCPSTIKMLQCVQTDVYYVERGQCFFIFYSNPHKNFINQYLKIY